MQPLLNIAVRAARRAGEVIVRSLGRVDTLTITAKDHNDFVTEVDQAAEREIIGSIRRFYPNHSFLGEESGVSGPASKPGLNDANAPSGATSPPPSNSLYGNAADVLWIIDPLDGTTNFLHGNPVFGVSIACQIRGRLEHAVVYDPMRQELFTASRGEGALLDNRRIRVSTRKGLEGALIGTGFPYRANIRWIDEYLRMLRDVMISTAGVRRPGAASLDLAYVAAGRLDAFWELGLAPWDTAAGTLLIEEAGGRIGTLTGAEYTQGGHVVAGAPKVYEALLQLLAPNVPADLRDK